MRSRLIQRKARRPPTLTIDSSHRFQETSMFQRILVPVDGSETSTKALVAALELARNTNGRVRILHYVDELASISGFAYGIDLKRIARDEADEVLQDALAVARSAGIPADSRLVETRGQRLAE